MGDGQTDVVSLWETLAMGEQNLLVSAGSAPAPNSISCISTAYHENQIFRSHNNVPPCVLDTLRAGTIEGYFISEQIAFFASIDSS
jgi:hypothetical protein